MARFALFLVLALLSANAFGATEKSNKAVERCNNAAELLDEIMGTPDHAIPTELLRRAHCIALIPGVKKAGLVFAAKYGKGVLLCRGEDTEDWSGPSAIRLEGGGFGLQIGGSSTDLVLLVMNKKGAEKLISSKFTLGADASVAGGPVGRSAQAQTDAQMHAKILSYSRSRGIFAGVSVEGATLRPDAKANLHIYGRDVAAAEILAGKIPAPESTVALLHTLDKYSSPDEKDSKSLTQAERQPPPSPPAPARAQRADGLLKITSEPSLAEVELNRNFNGLTPRAKVVKPGEYEITLRKKGFQTWTQSISVGPDETVNVHVELSKPISNPTQPESENPKQESGMKPTENPQFEISGLR